LLADLQPFSRNECQVCREREQNPVDYKQKILRDARPVGIAADVAELKARL